MHLHSLELSCLSTVEDSLEAAIFALRSREISLNCVAFVKHSKLFEALIIFVCAQMDTDVHSELSIIHRYIDRALLFAFRADRVN